MKLSRWSGVLLTAVLSVAAGEEGLDAETDRPIDAGAAPSTEADEISAPRDEAEADASVLLPEVEVEARREPLELDPIASRTTVTSEELDRRQSDNVFEVLQDLPGVSVNGGPLANGMKFNIRGFSDTEDVLITLDGAQRNFEKYRFGGGVFVEPELLKQIEVTRGPAGTLQGSGAIGGVVAMETKDARDLLTPGHWYGGRAKGGYATNNADGLYSLSAYGVLFDHLDLLGNLTRRESDDIVTASGEALENTAAQRDSRLLKGKLSLHTDAYVSVSNIDYQGSTLEPFDATAGQPGVFGFVRRAIEDSTTTVNLRFRPRDGSARNLIDLKGSLGYTDTTVADTGTETSILPETTTNYFDYDIATLNVTNTSVLEWGGLRNAFTYGIQTNRNARSSRRLNRLLPPGEQSQDNLDQPSGTRKYFAYLLQNALYVGDFSLTGGFRHDSYSVEVAARQTRELLEAEGRNTIVEYSRSSPSAGISYNVLGGPVTLFYQYTEAFRPPLVDEYFTQGPFSRCNRFFLGDLAPASAICGDLYGPETSANHEIGASLEYAGLFDTSDVVRAKLTFFRNDVGHTLESLSARTAKDELCEPFNFLADRRDCVRVSQDGKERIEGVEVEMSYQGEHWFGNLSYAAIRGEQTCDGKNPLFDIPGDSVVFSLGRNDFDGKLQYGYRLRAVGERLVVTGAAFSLSPCNVGLSTGTQDGYVLHNLFVSVRPTEFLRLDLSVDNLDNTRYFLNNGFGGGIGQEAPGTDIRLSLSLSF